MARMQRKRPINQAIKNKVNAPLAVDRQAGTKKSFKERLEDKAMGDKAIKNKSSKGY